MSVAVVGAVKCNLCSWSGSIEDFNEHLRLCHGVDPTMVSQPRPMGCICPGDATPYCNNQFCPRKAVPGMYRGNVS